MDAPEYPFGPGHRGVDTSIAAAALVEPITAAMQKLVLTAVTDAGPNGITVVEMATRYDQDRMTVQPRFSELRRQGRIVDGGMRRKNPSGVSAIVWTLPQFALPAPDRRAA